MTFAQQRNRLTTHFSEHIPVVKRRMTIWSWVIPAARQEIHTTGNYREESTQHSEHGESL